MQEPRPFLIGGLWRRGEALIPVNDPFTGRLLAEVSSASSADAEAAIQSTVDAAPAMGSLPSHARYQALQKIAGGLYDRREEFARLMTAESGKPITDAKREVNRAVQTFTIAAEEAKRIPGEVYSACLAAHWQPLLKFRLPVVSTALTLAKALARGVKTGIRLLSSK